MTQTRTKAQAFELIAKRVEACTGDECTPEFVRGIWDRFLIGQKPRDGTRNERLAFDKILVGSGLIKDMPDN